MTPSETTLLPKQLSSYASEVDALFWYVNALSIFFTIGIILAIIIFTIRYRRKSHADRPKAIHGSLGLELTWSIIPLIFFMTFFVWGANLFFKSAIAPADAMEVLVTGKQWMWKIQHPTGKREINYLHVPAGTPIKITMTSEDVIHSFYLPALRTKMDCVPGKYTQMWFQADEPGEYHLFCAEYCGTEHSTMGGKLIVMTPEDYAEWSTSTAGAAQPLGANASPIEKGKALFLSKSCATCHMAGPAQLGPDLAGILGQEREFTDGTKITADENYLRESMTNPLAKVVKGRQPVMPPVQLSDEEMMHLIAYIKSLEAE